MKVFRLAVISLVFAVCLLILMRGHDSTGVSPFAVESLVGGMATDFSLSDMSGAMVSLSSFRGKVVLLNFWATWCPPCKSEMSSFNELYRRLKSEGLEVVAVSSDRSRKDIQKFLSKKKLSFTILHDEDAEITKRYMVFSLPTTFLIDRQGIIVERYLGEYDWTEAEVVSRIKELTDRK